jgi:predicted phage tail component-like protein
MTWGFTYRGVHSSTYGIEIISVGGRSILPGIFSKNFTVPSMHGQHYFGFRFDKRELDIDILLNSSTLEEFRQKNRDLADWLNPMDGEGILIFDDEPDVKYMAVMTNAQDWDQTRSFGTSLLRFICPDPFVYSLTPTVHNFSSGSFGVANNGNMEAPPIITINFTAPASELELTIGDEYFRLVRSFVIGNKLTINCDTGEIMLGTQDIRASMDIESDFPYLKPGSNTVSINPSSGVEGSISFTERWI